MEQSPRCQVPDRMVIEQLRAQDGWSLRRFMLEAETTKVGNLAFLGGRGDFFEKYLEPIAHWSRSGWSVTGFDWRGQGGSGQLGQGNYNHGVDFGQLVDDLAGFVASWQRETSGPHVVVGHSMGGHVLLRACAEKRIAPDGLVLVSPMIGIRAGPLSPRMLRALARLGTLPGLGQLPLWRGPQSPHQRHVTSCPIRNGEKLWWKQQRPELARGAPTWGWLAAATASIAALRTGLAARPVTTPMLVLYAQSDAIIDIQALQQARPYLANSDFVAVPEAAHELLRERDTPRLDCLRRIDKFLAACSARR